MFSPWNRDLGISASRSALGLLGPTLEALPTPVGVLGAAPPLPWELGLLSVARYFMRCRFCVFSFYGVAQKNLNCGVWGREGRGS